MIILAICLSVSGFLFGRLLANIAKEELKPGKRYFIASEKVLLALAFAPAFYILYNDIIMAVSILLVFLAFEFIRFPYRIFVVYAVFIAFFILTSGNPSVFIAEASFIFVYGLVAGTLFKN